jgi:hypothetical protein
VGTGFRTTQQLSLIAVFAVSAIAQTSSISAIMGGFGTVGEIGGIVAGNPLMQLTGRPYSAEQVTEQVQTLADGTHMSQATRKVRFYRDSADRTRTEHIFTPPPGAAMRMAGQAFIEIADPVAGYRYTLDQHNQVARRMAWPPVLPQLDRGVRKTVPSSSQNSANILRAKTDAAADVTSARPHPITSRESLGAQIIEGITVEGMRTTVTYPEGFLGNDRPITTVSETWSSAELKTVVLSKTSDPRWGETTTKLINISQTEPEPSLFQIPADYSVEDEPQPGVTQR